MQTDANLIEGGLKADSGVNNKELYQQFMNPNKQAESDADLQKIINQFPKSKIFSFSTFFNSSNVLLSRVVVTIGVTLFVAITIFFALIGSDFAFKVAGVERPEALLFVFKNVGYVIAALATILSAIVAHKISKFNVLHHYNFQVVKGDNKKTLENFMYSFSKILGTTYMSKAYKEGGRENILDNIVDFIQEGNYGSAQMYFLVFFEKAVKSLKTESTAFKFGDNEMSVLKKAQNDVGLSYVFGEKFDEQSTPFLCSLSFKSPIAFLSKQDDVSEQANIVWEKVEKEHKQSHTFFRMSKVDYFWSYWFAVLLSSFWMNSFSEIVSSIFTLGVVYIFLYKLQKNKEHKSAFFWNYKNPKWKIYQLLLMSLILKSKAFDSNSYEIEDDLKSYWIDLNEKSPEKAYEHFKKIVSDGIENVKYQNKKDLIAAVSMKS